MSVTISVDGCESVAAALDGICEEMLPCAAKGLAAGLKLIQRDAKQQCPAATGELRNSIRTDVKEFGTFVSGSVTAAKEYAVYVEMGTGDKGRASGGNGSPVKGHYRTGGWFVPLGQDAVMMGDTEVKPGSKGFWTTGQPARPYLYPAFKANKSKVAAMIAAAIAKGG